VAYRDDGDVWLAGRDRSQVGVMAVTDTSVASGGCMGTLRRLKYSVAWCPAYATLSGRWDEAGTEPDGAGVHRAVTCRWP